MNPNEIVTVKHLEDFKNEIIQEIRMLLDKEPTEKKQWLKKKEVLALLQISANTLQTLRNNGTIPFKKLGGIIYYNIEDIQSILKSK